MSSAHSVFTSLPVHCSDNASLISNLHLLIEDLSSKVAVNSPPGVWVCSTDMRITVDSVIEACQFTDKQVLAVSFSVDRHYACQHGVYACTTDSRILEDIVYKETPENLKKYADENDQVSIVAGIVYFRADFAEKLLSSPLYICTYLDLDCGATPIKLSIFFDILLSMALNTKEESFIAGKHTSDTLPSLTGSNETRSPDDAGDHAQCLHLQEITRTRRSLWKLLHKSRVHVVTIAGSYLYNEMVTHRSSVLHNGNTKGSRYTQQTNCHSYGITCSAAENSVCINSLCTYDLHLSRDSIASHCLFNGSGQMNFGEGCVITGLDTNEIDLSKPLDIPAGYTIQMVDVLLEDEEEEACCKVLVIFKLDDDLETNCGGSIFGEELSELTTRIARMPCDFWEDQEEEMQLINGLIFPCIPNDCKDKPKIFADFIKVFVCKTVDYEFMNRWKKMKRLSLKQIYQSISLVHEFQNRRKLYSKIACYITEQTMLDVTSDTGLTKMFRISVIEGFHEKILEALDNVSLYVSDTSIICRCFANIACLLSLMSNGCGGLLSGPAANPSWSMAMQLLQKGDYKAGVQELRVQRNKWLNRADLLIRAARHYEGAFQILIRRSVKTSDEFIETSLLRGVDIEFGAWVEATCPARIDLAGGWSDTPPISYERGGACLNVAVTIDGKKPIGARAKKIKEYVLVLKILNENDLDSLLITIRDFAELNDYSHPSSPGALLKAAFCCAGIVNFDPDSVSLSEYLRMHYGCGFYLETWSFLPQGSGLGTSSILAGVVISVLWTITLRSFSLNSLFHAVLNLEQLMTTGGGWQDQIGGIMPGIKLGYSRKGLPLQIFTRTPIIDCKVIKDLDDRLLLIYSGKTRLAKNLLQNVLRNWYARDEDMVRTVDSLRVEAEQCAEAFERGDLADVCSYINRYWGYKKIMAVGCEPTDVAMLIHNLEDIIMGSSMAGAGGGGFMYIITKEPHQWDTVQRIINENSLTSKMTLHRASIDKRGLELKIDGLELELH